MSESVAGLFSSNKEDLFIVPLSPQPLQLSSHFENAAGPVSGQIPKQEISVSTPANTNAPLVAENAAIAGESLRSMEGVRYQPPQDGAGYLGAQVGKMGMEVGGAALNLGKDIMGALFGGGDDNKDTGPAPEFAVQRPAPAFGMPSPG